MLMDLFYHVTMSDGSVWAIPISTIALNRARHYQSEFGEDLERSLCEDTLPLFKQDHSEIAGWARGNMDWADVKDAAVRVSRPQLTDFSDGWVNGEWKIKGDQH